MHKILYAFIIVSTLVHALYNPFFIEDKPREAVESPKEEVVTKVIVQAKPASARRSINMTYFGFVSSNVGEFALVGFNGKNIVISQNDSLYNNEEIFKVAKITSNYIVINDKQGRAQTVYFSSEAK